VLLEGIKLIRRIGRTSPVSEYHLEVDMPEDFENLTDEQLVTHIENSKSYPARAGA
jgi:hypothetical protein